MPHHGVLQNRGAQRDRRLLPTEGSRPCLVVIVATDVTYHPARGRTQQTMASAAASEKTDWTITGVEEPGLRPNAAAAEAPMEPGVRTSAERSR